MKFPLPLVVCVLSLGLAIPARAQNGAPRTARERLGYALGAEVGATFKQQGIDFDLAAFNAAVRDAMTGGRMQMTNSQIQETIMGAGKNFQPKGNDQPPAEKNRRDGEAFLAANKSRPGVVSLPDGLQYKVLAEGTGPTPAATDVVTVKYRGTLIDGTEFDSSDKHAGTATFAANEAGGIAGLSEALQKMRAGARWQVFIPPALAFADRAIGTSIGPGSTLIFEVELVSIQKK